MFCEYICPDHLRLKASDGSIDRFTFVACFSPLPQTQHKGFFHLVDVPTWTHQERLVCLVHMAILFHLSTPALLCSKRYSLGVYVCVSRMRLLGRYKLWFLAVV